MHCNAQLRSRTSATHTTTEPSPHRLQEAGRIIAIDPIGPVLGLLER